MLVIYGIGIDDLFVTCASVGKLKIDRVEYFMASGLTFLLVTVFVTLKDTMGLVF